MDERGDKAMKRILAVLAALMLLPVLAAAEIRMTELADSETGSTLVVFEAVTDAALLEAGKMPAPDPVLMGINAQIEIRFMQEEAGLAMGRAGAQVLQIGSLYQDGRIASMGLLWRGEQADGREGCSGFGLACMGTPFSSSFSIRAMRSSMAASSSCSGWQARTTLSSRMVRGWVAHFISDSTFINSSIMRISWFSLARLP